MAIVDFFPAVWYPRQATIDGGNPAIVSTTAIQIDAASEFIFHVFQAPRTGNIRRLGFRTGTVTTGATVDVALYSVASGALPGTPNAIWGTNTNASLVIDAADDLRWFWVTLTADASVTRGEYAGMRIANPASSFGDIQFSAGDGFGALPFPYSLENTSQTGAIAPIAAIEYDDGTVYCPGQWIGAGSTTAGGAALETPFITSISTPDHYGVRFQVPISMRLSHLQLLSNLGGDGAYYLVDSAWDGTPGDALASIPWDEDRRSTTGGGLAMLLFDTSVTLEADTWYRVVFAASTTANTPLSNIVCPDQGTFLAQTNGGKFHLTTAKDPNDDSDWTNFDNGTDGYKIPCFYLGFDGIDDGGGGSPGGSPPVSREIGFAHVG